MQRFVKDLSLIRLVACITHSVEAAGSVRVSEESGRARCDNYLYQHAIFNLIIMAIITERLARV